MKLNQPRRQKLEVEPLAEDKACKVIILTYSRLKINKKRVFDSSGFCAKTAKTAWVVRGKGSILAQLDQSSTNSHCQRLSTVLLKALLVPSLPFPWLSLTS